MSAVTLTRVMLFSAIVLAASIAIGLAKRSHPSCRTIPGDKLWPSATAWSSFNETVGGRLIATVPIAAPCHAHYTSSENKSIPTYDKEECDALRNVWFLPQTHLPSPSSPMAYQFTNDTCNPWSSPDTTCSLGGQVAFTVNATCADDVQKTVKFAKDNNIRLVIRNTGHDYLGKSTGAHALAVWTLYMKDIKIVENYESAAYSGPALKVGAGVEGIEALTFASSHNLMIAGGNCPTVGIAGGFTQGGGHGHLASKYGLAADQVLEAEVVTAAGELVTANANTRPDLLWALRGGGGGTYGVVVSMTIKAFPDTFVSTAYATVLNNGTNTDALYEAIGTFLQTLPGLVDAGAYVVWVAAPFGFMLMPAIGPSIHQSDLDTLLQPFTTKLTELGLEHQYNSAEHPTFLTHYNSIAASWNVSDYALGGRLIPRSIVEQSPEKVLDAVRFVSSHALMSGVTFNVANAVSSPDDVAANPAFRDTLFAIALGTPINYTDWSATLAGQDMITDVLMPRLAEIAPGGGAYLNEADFRAKDWKSLFYGTHYERLERVKRRYDPEDVFYARTAVGSDGWAEDGLGRLCRV